MIDQINELPEDGMQSSPKTSQEYMVYLKTGLQEGYLSIGQQD